MELKLVKKDDKSLVLEVQGESIGFVNAIREELWKDKSVLEADFRKEHPYLAEPKIIVKTSRGEPEVALEKACERIIEKIEEFKEKFKAELKF